ncbi:MAG: zinc-ribbon domain-containing protein, partial [Eubacterium sp.]|nr:zinc-ribbon domain-containing protein [Eubacterium sp.]
MICPNCGKEITDESTSCQFCGSAVTAQAQPEFASGNGTAQPEFGNNCEEA